jgi:hypothetical protein
MAIDLPLESEEKSTKSIPGKRAQNGLPSHNGQEEAGTKHTPGIMSGVVVESPKATNISSSRSLRACHHQWQRLWPLRNRQHPSWSSHSQRIALDYHVAIFIAVGRIWPGRS